ncbi:MAG: hypothetical protein KBB70_02765 [Candidatus Pacebacteria bacterium]|jgi:ABC-type spermidine/putrescine transport system permease subunit I|nr:hypothetical protein [Candidatus Paceibacterota bacterium]
MAQRVDTQPTATSDRPFAAAFIILFVVIFLFQADTFGNLFADAMTEVRNMSARTITIILSFLTFVYILRRIAKRAKEKQAKA